MAEKKITGPASYIAFSLSCPHQGVKLTQEANGWVCDAHGSEFEADGDLVWADRILRIAI